MSGACGWVNEASSVGLTFVGNGEQRFGRKFSLPVPCPDTRVHSGDASASMPTLGSCVSCGSTTYRAGRCDSQAERPSLR
ncbi:hypothetical protein MILUP08_43346 [Micromonospora lupini str. Lupac 08]|uniref:Uncharacterized protein n=1 Tax=Micromonospora lupini str. Lupac 08 TaxID=1150864 RepID=I0L3N9_9ACTN|nr:hypothetical protein MILUP08_43346 [Micromonospora lupini str. Lupac 08]